MKNSILILTVLFSFLTQAQDSVSVLFIGNSYTYVNDLPTVFSNLTTSLGDEVTIDSKTNGGFTFGNHLADPLTHTKIQSKPWDFVVLQGQSQEPSFPTNQVNTATLPPAVDLADSIYSNKFCSQPMYFMTWGRQVGDPQWDSINTFYKMNDRLRNAYVRISDSAQACVSPVGVAWKYVRDTHPTINLYSPDGSHPSVEGTYLAACTFYASVFRKTPIGASFTFGLDATTAGYLQEAAAIAVLDSLDTWHLRPTEDITIAAFHSSVTNGTVDFFNDSWRATSYEWDFGDGTVGVQENITHTYAQNGVYSVRLIALSECGNDTIYHDVTISMASMDQYEPSEFVLKTLGEGKFTIDILGSNENLNVTLLNPSGQEVKQNNLIEFEGETIHLDLSVLSQGVYFLKLMNEGEEVVIKLPTIH